MSEELTSLDALAKILALVGVVQVGHPVEAGEGALAGDEATHAVRLSRCGQNILE